VALSITDTGEPLDEEARRRIFEPFFSTREQEQDNGLGLATVYGIAKQSRGTIEVTSHPGAGTTFRVYLPRVES
jgi:two-component system cell cycle sensor histidine kinase/response regulator CckA